MRVILFGFNFLCGVWGASAQEWVQLSAGGEGPSARTHGAAIYDSRDHRMILFGGRGSSGDRGDVWAFDLTAHSWSDITPASIGPMARFTHNALYDEAAHQMIIWSGRYVTAEGGGFLNDVWAFDLNGESWTELAAPDPVPLERYGTAAVFHPPQRRLVNFAGFTTAGRFEDVWSFDLDTQLWTEISTTSDPGARCLHSASYDDSRQQMIIYGGQRGSAALDDLWALDLASHTWTNLASGDRPLGRIFATQVYDASNSRVIIFGGNRDRDGVDALTDEVLGFDLDQSSWVEMVLSGESPEAREGSVAIYVGPQDRMIVFGGNGLSGNFDDVWSLERLSGARPTAISGRQTWGRIKSYQRD